jgi:hypothetical protein
LKKVGEQLGNTPVAAGLRCEVLIAEELAARWRVPESWVREQTRSRCMDPIPHVRLGRYVRFSWNSPELNDWWERHQVGNGHAA